MKITQLVVVSEDSSEQKVDVDAKLSDRILGLILNVGLSVSQTSPSSHQEKLSTVRTHNRRDYEPGEVGRIATRIRQELALGKTIGEACKLIGQEVGRGQGTLYSLWSEIQQGRRDLQTGKRL